MSSKLVCYGKNEGNPTGGARTLTANQRFSVLVIEHVLGSELFYMDQEVDDFQEQLAKFVTPEEFFLTDVVFQQLIEAKLVTPTAIYSPNALHELMNWAKKHVDQEWRIRSKDDSAKDGE